MCFSIPYRVLAVNKQTAIVEGNKKVKLDKELNVKEGDFLRVIGNIAVEKLTNSQGTKIRRTIKSLY